MKPITFLTILLACVGYFTGTITGEDETVYEIHTMLGVTEEHFAKW